MRDRLLGSLGAVVLTCVAVVVLAPFVLSVLPALLIVTLAVWMGSLLFKGWGGKGF